MASNYGIGSVGYGLEDMHDVRIPGEVKKQSSHNKSFVFKYRHDGRVLVLSPHTGVDTSLAALTDIDPAIPRRVQQNDATPFGLAWVGGKWSPHSIPRNFAEILGGEISSAELQEMSGHERIPYALVMDPGTKKFRLFDATRLYFDPRVKLLDIPLHLRLSPVTVIEKRGEIRRILNSGDWYCHYNFIGLTKANLYYDSQIKVLGLKAGADQVTLEMGSETELMVDHMKTVTTGTILIDCIKLNSEGEYDTLIDEIGIKSSARGRILIKIQPSSRGPITTIRAAEASDAYLVENNSTKNTIDIGTIKLQRIILISFKYHTDDI